MSAAIGWSLVHFLWQGALIALLLEIALGALQNRSSELRYTVRCIALGAMALAPVITLAVLTANPQPLPREALLAAALAGMAPARELVWTDAVTLVWSLGASFCAVRLLRDWLRVRRLQSTHAGGLLPLAWQVRYDDIAELLQVVAVARVVDSASLAAPTVIGWLKPVVLIPARVLTGLDQDQVEALLAHELAHVRRHDYLVNLVQSAVEALLFYHPAVWWVSSGIRAEREYCCDDVALRVTHNRLSYARALTTLEGWRGTELEIAMSTLGGPLMQRIQRLVGVRPSNSLVRGPMAAFAAMLVLGCATSAFGHDPAGAQDPQQVRELRAEIEAMEARLAQLKAQLGQATHKAQRYDTDENENVWVERIHPDDGDVHVFRKGDHEVFELKSGGGEGNRRVWRFDSDGAQGEIVVEVHADGDIPTKVHEHVRDALRSHGVTIEHGGGTVGSGEGEGNIIIEILGDDGQDDFIRRRVRIGGVPGGSGRVMRVEGVDGGNVVIDLDDLEQQRELHGKVRVRTGNRTGNSGAWIGSDGDRGTLALRESALSARENAHLRQLDVEKLHQHLQQLRHVEGIDVEQLHERILKALEQVSIEIHDADDHHARGRVLKLNELGELKELEGLMELKELGELHELHRLDKLHGTGHDGDVRVLRLDGDVKLDLDDDLLEKVHKARIELRLEHEAEGERQDQKESKTERVVRADDPEIV